MAQNSLMYLNQSVPPYAVALNSIARKATNFPLSRFLNTIYDLHISSDRNIEIEGNLSDFFV
jgi:hypothetical protein